MYGGDEVNAIVVDQGTHTVKAGYAGEEAPKVNFPSCVGAVTRNTHDAGSSGSGDARGDTVMSEAGEANGGGDASTQKSSSKPGRARDLYNGHFALNYRRDRMEVISPFKQGLLDDWEAVESQLRFVLEDRMQVDPKEHPVLLGEPNFNKKPLREKSVEILFEKFGSPAAFLCKNAALASYSMGRPTSLVLDVGYNSSSACAVHDGYVLERSCARSGLAGKLLSECMLRCVEAKDIPVTPRYAFKRKEVKPGTFENTPLDLPHTSESYRRWCVSNIAADLKESVCRVSEAAFVEAEHVNVPTVTYELPDGSEVHVGADRFKVPEVLFNPAIISSFKDAETITSQKGPLRSLTSLVMDSVQKVDVDVRKELFGGIILTGGTSMMANLRERLERELLEAAPTQARVKVMASQNAIERRYAVWIGGSILASLGSFQQCWMSKQEYEEKGAHFIHFKAP